MVGMGLPGTGGFDQRIFASCHRILDARQGDQLQLL
jgi:hypothetical protein